MDIRFFDPLGRAYARMKKALFQPFDIRKWFVVGFTAFLAQLTDCGGGNGSAQGQGMGDSGNWNNLIYFPHRITEWLAENPFWFFLILAGLLIVIVVAVILTWVSARGKFMFLDNVIHDRALVRQPWYEFRVQGNSLFLWSVSLGILTLAILLPYLVVCYFRLVELYERTWQAGALLGPLILMVLGLIGIILILSFVELLVVDFIVPIMYRSGSGILAAWKTFLPLFRSHLLSFVGYGFFMLGLTVLIGIGILLAVLLTCCIGLLFLIIPYINVVILLPVSYTLRAFSLEFLEQFGPAYRMFPEPLTPPSQGTGTEAFR